MGRRNKPHDLMSKILERVEFEPNTGCWLWSRAANTNGYGVISLGVGRQALVHRIAYQEAVGPIPDRHVVCHRCDTPACCNPDHLFVGSQWDNVADMHRKGRDRKRGLRGPENHKAKLTWAQVGEIRALRWQVRQTELAERYGVSQTVISDIQRERIWTAKGDVDGEAA